MINYEEPEPEEIPKEEIEKIEFAQQEQKKEEEENKKKARVFTRSLKKLSGGRKTGKNKSFKKK